MSLLQLNLDVAKLQVHKDLYLFHFLQFKISTYKYFATLFSINWCTLFSNELLSLICTHNFLLWSLRREIYSFLFPLICQISFCMFYIDFWFSWRITFETYFMSFDATKSSSNITFSRIIFSFL